MEMVKRSERVMVRLSRLGGPDELALSRAERKAVESAADSHDLPLSSFVRQVCLMGAKATVVETLDDWGVCKAAADQCGLPLGAWMREVTLGAIGFSPLASHIRKATSWASRV